MEESVVYDGAGARQLGGTAALSERGGLDSCGEQKSTRCCGNNEAVLRLVRRGDQPRLAHTKAHLCISRRSAISDIKLPLLSSILPCPTVNTIPTHNTTNTHTHTHLVGFNLRKWHVDHVSAGVARQCLDHGCLPRPGRAVQEQPELVRVTLDGVLACAR